MLSGNLVFPAEALVSSRSLADWAGLSVVAPEVSVLAKVELLPLTDWGFESLLSLKPPPELADSAARESDATAPAPSLMGSSLARGSVVFCGEAIIRQW